MEQAEKISYILYLSIALALSIPLSRFFATLAIKLGIVDHPDKERKLHNRITPYMGGVVMYIIFLAIVFAGLYQRAYDNLLYGIFGITILFVMGLLDDIRPISAKLKFLLQIPAIGLIFIPLTIHRIILLESSLTMFW